MRILEQELCVEKNCGCDDHKIKNMRRGNMRD